MSPLPFVLWKENYSVGNKELDKHHREIIDIINDLFTSIKSDSGENKVGAILERLYEYTKTHFAREEQLMKEHIYPELPAHKNIHEKMIQKTSDLRRLQMYNADVANDVLSLLKDWWLNHIRVLDAKYKKYLIEPVDYGL